MPSRARVNATSDTQQLAEDLRRASSQVPQNVVYTSGRFTAQIGQVNRVRGTVLCLLPPADQASAGGETTVLLEGGTLTVTCPSGTVNARTSIVFSSASSIVFKSTGKGGWLCTQAEQQVRGRYLRVTAYLAAGSGTHVLSPDTRYVEADIVGGSGGAGGVATGGAGSGGATGGGGAGAYRRVGFFPSGNVPYTVGAAGTGGAAAAGNGGNGGDSSVTTPSATRTAAGGVGSVGITAAVAYNKSLGGVGGATPAGSETIVGSAGNPGGQALMLPTAAAFTVFDAITGAGGASFFGGGGRSFSHGNNTQSAGQAGGAPGAGPAGTSCRGTGVSVAGTAGEPGAVIFYEYA